MLELLPLRTTCSKETPRFSLRALWGVRTEKLQRVYSQVRERPPETMYEKLRREGARRRLEREEGETGEGRQTETEAPGVAAHSKQRLALLGKETPPSARAMVILPSPRSLPALEGRNSKRGSDADRRDASNFSLHQRRLFPSPTLTRSVGIV